MNIIYLDRLSIFSIFSIIWSRIDYPHIFYFNASPNGKKLIKIFRKLRILKVEPLLAEFILGEIRDEKGGCRFLKIWEDLRDICFEISEKELKNNNFLKKFNTHFDFRKIVLFFEKIVAEEINDKVVFVHAAKWHADNKIISNEKSVIFFLEKDLWSDYLSRYIQSLNIKSVDYCTMISSSYLTFFERGKKVFLSKVKSKINTPETNEGVNKGSKEKNTEAINPDTKSPLIAAWYTGKTVTFDLKKRSDFFWLLKSDIPRGQVLIYFDRKDIPATEETVNILNREGTKCLALSTNATTSKDIYIWNPTRKYQEMKRYFSRMISKAYLLHLANFRKIPLFFIIWMFYFIRQYSYWYDFFNSNNIKISISPNDFSKLYMPKNLAMEHCGGVSVSCQWSNLSFSSIGISNCSNVMFSFGPAYKWVWEANHSTIDNLIYCGYITDYSFKEVKESAIKLKNQLLSKGVKFIICCFDENSMDDRMGIITNERSARIYKYLIEKMLEDETLGLIFKPVFPKTLYKRISSISNFIEKAKASGRCIFMDKGSYVTEQYPTEAAQAADLCVGLLLSGTVALESYLSGTPVVFLDLEKLYSNPVYQWGKGKVVFDNLDDMFSAINKYRENPESIPDFGDLSLWAKDKDPFKDGNASLRIGQYINWLLEMFNQGKTREEAIEYANQRYARLWGKENIGVGIKG